MQQIDWVDEKVTWVKKTFGKLEQLWSEIQASINIMKVTIKSSTVRKAYETMLIR